MSRNNDAHHHEFLQADFYLEDIFLVPHGTTFLTDEIGKSDGRPPLPAAVVCRAAGEPLRCARRSKVRMLLRNRIDNAALLRSDGVGPPIPFPFKLRVEARGAFLFSVITVLFAAPHDETFDP